MIEFNATIFVSMLSFVIFMFIMNLIFYKPMFAIIKKRQDYIDNNNNITAEMSQKTEKLSSERTMKIENAKDSFRQSLKSELESARQESDNSIKAEKELSKQAISDLRDSLNKQYLSEKENINSSILEDLSDFIVDKVG